MSAYLLYINMCIHVLRVYLSIFLGMEMYAKRHVLFTFVPVTVFQLILTFICACVCMVVLMFTFTLIFERMILTDCLQFSVAYYTDTDMFSVISSNLVVHPLPHL